MKPGDVLYLPRGQYHDALTGAQASLHVTFGVSPATGLALFKLLESALMQESAFRAYLPDARRRRDAARTARAARRASPLRHDLSRLCDRRAEPPARTGEPPAGYDLPAQQPPAWYSVARRAQVVRRDSGYAAVFDRGEIALGATYPTVEWLLKQRMFSLGDALARQLERRPGRAPCRACNSSSRRACSSKPRCEPTHARRALPAASMELGS